MNELSVTTSRVKAIGLSVLMLAFSVGSLILFIYHPEEKWIGICGTLFFGALAVTTILQIANPKPRLIINKTGIEFPRWNVGAMPWFDVKALSLDRMNNNYFLSIHLKDDEKYLKKLSHFKKRMFALNRVSRLPAFCVPLSLMNQSRETIYDTAKFFHAESMRR